MRDFFLAFAVGLGIICSFAGWGWLVIKVLRIKLGTGLGFNAAVGMAVSTTVGGILNWFCLISTGVVRGYLVAGLLIAAFAGARSARLACGSVISAWAYLRSRWTMSIGVLILVAVTVVIYATAVSPGQFHPQDDYHAYFVFPVKMLQTGHLGPDPFSERRIVSSLGGKFFLDTFPLSLTGQVRNLRLMDEGVAFVILMLLLLEIMRRKSIPIEWTIVLLLAASTFPAPVSNITAVYCGIVLLVLLFDLLDRTVWKPRLNSLSLLAVVLASLTTLKTTFAPMAGVFFLGYFGLQLFRFPSKARTLARAGFCMALIVTLLLPWMLDSYRSSATLFYPIFGKGFHGSRYGTYLLPTAAMGVHNVLAFLNGMANAVGAVLAIEVWLVFLAFRENRRDRLIDLVIVISLLVDVVFIGISTGAVQMYRYSFAILFATALFLLIQELAGFTGSSLSSSPMMSRHSLATVLLLGMLCGSGWHGFMSEQKSWRLTALEFALTGKNIDTPSETSEYRDMQLTIPAGEKVLVRLDKNFLLDFKRNPIYVNDLPGGASLPPGIPIFKGPEALADYLVRHDIRYLAYSYGDEASFSRALFGDRLELDVNVWLRKGAQIAFDFQDDALALGQRRKKLFDDGRMFVVDLGEPIQANLQALQAEELPIPSGRRRIALSSTARGLNERSGP